MAAPPWGFNPMRGLSENRTSYPMRFSYIIHTTSAIGILWTIHSILGQDAGYFAPSGHGVSSTPSHGFPWTVDPEDAKFKSGGKCPKGATCRFKMKGLPPHEVFFSKLTLHQHDQKGLNKIWPLLQSQIHLPPKTHFSNHQPGPQRPRMGHHRRKPRPARNHRAGPSFRRRQDFLIGF